MNDSKKEKKYIAYGTITQEDVDRIVYELREAHMSENDIAKVGEYKGWFRLNTTIKQKPNNIRGKK